MRQHRFFTEQFLQLHDTLKLENSVAHHCAQVLRYQLNDPLILFNGDGYDYQALITDINRRHCEVKILKKIALENESPLQIHLIQGIAKGDKMDFVIQKAVELGVTEFSPLFSQRCNVKLDEKRLAKKQQHWQRVMISACEQSGRARLMLINSAVHLNKIESIGNGAIEESNLDTETICRLYLDPDANSSLKSLDKPQSIQLCIGPEGGFSAQDVKAMQSLEMRGVQLGKRILRTETAGLVAVAALQSLFGDF
ncbi:MAG: 16S rRNA (uracil(1498)-N(3))-methyltransferase [Enterobacterales bacterium]|nr:16S rRNA (uracil(1498)-N(3))-methyltransferase [Enterobacterales bacterium]